MKSSYTKRALAFWLAVAMVATSAPMAFATASTSPTSTMTETSDVGTPTPQAVSIHHIKLSKESVTVNGKDAQSVTAIAYSSEGESGNSIDNSKITWSVSSSEGSGVSIDAATGKITVAAKAKAGTYTVTATPKDGVATEEAKTATLTVERKAAEATTIKGLYVHTTGDDGKIDVTDEKSIEIPAGESRTLSAEVLDQFGDAFSGTVTYTVSGNDNVKIDPSNSNVLKVEGNAEGTATVTATCGTVSKSFEVKVAKKAVGTVTISFGTSLDNLKYTGKPVQPSVTVTVGEDKKAESDLAGKVTYTYVEVIPNAAANALSTPVEMSSVTDVGTYEVTATYTDGDTIGRASEQFTIKQAEFSGTKDFEQNVIATDGQTYMFELPETVTSLKDVKFGTPTGTGTVVKSAKVEDGKLIITTNAVTSGSDTIRISVTSKNYTGFDLTYTLTIKPAVKSTITASAKQLSSSKDDNYKYWDLEKRSSGDGYLNLRADADDYLVNQRINGTSSEWIGMTIEPKVGSTRTTDGLWIAFSKTGTWYKLKDIGSKRSGDLYITDVDSDSFDLWFDTDDRDRTDSIYLATNSAGTENLFELEVDFDSYSGSSSSSSGSSSSDTSKVNGDRVSTTTVDKTPSVKNGSATVTFSSSALSDALDANKKEAKREDADKTYIELDVKTSKSVDDTTITVPRSSLDKIADEDTGLKLTTNQGTVTFDYRALAEIYDACDKTNIEFYLEEEDDDQYALLIKDGSSDVIDLGRGSVEVTFDYKLKSGEKSSDVKVYRIGNGDKTWLSTYGGSTVYGAADVYAAAPTYVTDMKADYSSSKKKVTFTTDALGTFLITTDTLKTGSGSTTTTPTYNAFVDVPSSRWSATYINKLASLGIINGTGGGYFEPTLYVTREEFVKMLAGVAGANVTGYTSSRFPDVPLSRWSAPYIAWAADRGITTGTDGGNFAPTMRITREEMATMIYRYVQSSGKTLPAKNAPVIFADANLISGWAQTPVSVMQQAGIIDGNVTNGRYTFDPKVSASREECAKMLAVLYDLVR